MTAAIERLKPAHRVADFGGSRCERDHIVLLQDVAWDEYERLLEIRGERSIPRIAFLDGVVEIMTPSMPHVSLKSRIGQLVEVWCLEKGVEFRAAGAWTLKNRRQSRALEPDECYVFGLAPGPRRPHLAIEVVWTPGRMNKLEIYRRIGVAEVWVWQRDVLSVHVLRGRAYEPAPKSEILRGIDLTELVRYLDRPTDSQCIREYRAHLRRRLRHK
jgi:Uma2 family endonuclease